MTVTALLSDLQARGVTLRPDGDKLRFYPADKVDRDLLDRLRDHKAELLDLLVGHFLAGGDGDTLAQALGELADAEQKRYGDLLAQRRAAGESEAGIEWRALVDLRLALGQWPPPTPPGRQASGRLLAGIAYPPRAPTHPDPRIIAAPATTCPTCNWARVLSELRTMTGGRCWGCWRRDLTRT